MATQAKKKPVKAPKAPPEPPRIRVSKVVLEGFKAFKDRFELDIPPPLARDDMDVFVIGSVNGVGKTSVLEGICLTMLPVMRDREWGTPWTLPDGRDGWDALRAMFVHAGTPRAALACDLQAGSEATPLRVDLPGSTPSLFTGGFPDSWAQRFGTEPSAHHRTWRVAVETMLGCWDEPVVAPPVLYFHSYRRVTAGPLALGDILGGLGKSDRGPVSAFKFAVLKTLLARADLLEEVSPSEATQPAIDRLNDLTREFAGVRVEKMGLSGDRLDIRVLEGSDGPSMPFDALSSGQKEIISTLFLIWETTRDCPSVVLIDEPELHLHPQWHDDVIRKLWELAPWNQYIIATHSERIARSVERDRLRILR